MALLRKKLIILAKIMASKLSRRDQRELDLSHPLGRSRSMLKNNSLIRWRRSPSRNSRSSRMATNKWLLISRIRTRSKLKERKSSRKCLNHQTTSCRRVK